MSIDQEHLLLCSDSRNAALDTIVLQHPREGGKIFQQCLHEGLRLLLIHVLFDVMFSHEVPRDALQAGGRANSTVEGGLKAGPVSSYAQSCGTLRTLSRSRRGKASAPNKSWPEKIFATKGTRGTHHFPEFCAFLCLFMATLLD